MNTIYVEFEQHGVVRIEGKRIFGITGELNELPKTRIKKIVGKRGM